MEFNLTYLRERANKSLQDVADQLGVSKATIFNWESEPTAISMEKISKYLEAVGATLADLYQQPTEYSYNIYQDETLIATRKKLVQTIIRLKDNENSVQNKTQAFTTTNVQALEELKMLQVKLRKPRLTVIGQSDVGKSSLINSILSENILPAKWTPTTAMTVKVIHSADKPTWLQGNTVVIEEKNTIVINDGDTLVNCSESWDLLDKKYYDAHIVEAGDRSLIKEFGDRNGQKYDSLTAKNYTIFTYVDAPILNVFEIWDTPGTGVASDEKGQTDEQLSIAAKNNADVLLYMSLANGFMRDSDVATLSKAIGSLPTLFNNQETLGQLANLFVIAAQADTVDNASDRQQILVQGANRLAQVLPTTEIGITTADINKRMFAYSKKDQNISAEFITEFEKFAKDSQTIIKENELNMVKVTMDRIIKKIDLAIAVNNDDVEVQKENREKFEAAKLSLPVIEKQAEENYNQLTKTVAELRKQARNGFELNYRRLITEENLLALLEDGEFKNSKQGLEDYFTTVTNKIDFIYQNELKSVSKKFNDEIKAAMSAAQVDSQVDINTFDFTALLAGLVTSGLTMGAFATLAGTISSNLGLYILVAQAGGILTNLGIISSPVILTQTVFAFGGPVGWAIGISLFAGLAVASVFGLVKKNAWKDKVVKQTINVLDEKNAINEYLKAIDKFMDETQNGVVKFTEATIKIAKENVRTLKKYANSNEAYLNVSIDQLNTLKVIMESVNY